MASMLVSACRCHRLFTATRLGVQPGVAVRRWLSSGPSNSAVATTKSSSGHIAATGTPSPMPAWRRLAQFARPEAGRLGSATVLLLASSAVTMSVPFGIGTLLDTIASDPEPQERLWQLGLVLSGAFCVGAIANFGRIYLIQTSGQRIITRLRKDVFAKLLRQDISYFDVRATGTLTNRLSADTVVVGKALSDNLSDGLRSASTAILGTGMMMYMSPQLTGLVLCVVPPIMLVAVGFGRYVKEISKRVQDALAGANQVAEERVANIRTVKALASEEGEKHLYGQEVDKAYQLARTEAIVRGLFYGSAGLAGNAIILTVLWHGGSLLLEDKLSIGYLTSFLMYSAYTGSSIVGLSSFYTESMKGLGASQRLLEIVEEEPAIRPDMGLKLPAEELQGTLRFEDVSFHYPQRTDIPVLSGVTVDVPAGTSIALVGASGCGKSTLGSLLLRLYDPVTGRVSLDGHDTKDLEWTWLRQQIGYVGQEPVLFTGTIAETIGYACPDASRHDIEEAARSSNALEFISRFPEQFDTLVGERGVTLSGGQRQRLAIARAILKRPKIFLFDEATSALDVESEKLVIEALDRVTRSGTVLLIAHRESTIRSADQVAMLDSGKIVEHGTFDDLMHRRGAFYSLMQSRSTEVT